MPCVTNKLAHTALNSLLSHRDNAHSPHIQTNIQNFPDTLPIKAQMEALGPARRSNHEFLEFSRPHLKDGLLDISLHIAGHENKRHPDLDFCNHQ